MGMHFPALIGSFRVLSRALLAAGAVLALSAPALADWRTDLGTFRIGMTSSDASGLSPAEISELQTAYAKALGMPVEITAFRDYPSLIDAQASSRIEYAIYSATAYGTAWIACECVEPLVAPVQTNGAIGLRSVLVLNAGAAFTRLDLNGIRIGVPGKDSVTGLAIPLVEYTIGSRVLSPDERFFSVFPDAAANTAAFVSGKIDGFFGWAASDANGAVAQSGLMNSGTSISFTDGRKSVDIKTPWTSNLLRYGPHAVRRNLPPEIKQVLRNFLTSLDPDGVDLFSLMPPHDLAKFSEVRQADYNLAIAVAKAAVTASK